MRCRLHPVVLPVLIALAIAPPAPAQSALEKHRDFLTRIRSPEEMVLPRFPRQYSVPVSLSGAVAEEMRQTLAELDIEQPEYIETLDRKNRFQLVLANENYSLETRDLLSGILNPVDMIDAVLRSIVRYRQKEQLTEMLRETEMSRSVETRDGVRMHVIRLVPTGKRFSYAYEDLGAYVQESWLTRIELVVDSATMIARQLDLVKYTRLFRTDDTKKPKAIKKHQQYVFTYMHFEGSPVPAGLTVYLDSVRTLSISAQYRTQENHVLFDSRRICYYLPDNTQSCLDMKYGAYNLDATSLVFKAPVDGGNRAKQIMAAAELARKASDALKQGRIDTAVRILRSLAQNYAGTPQAVEAQKLLDGLPEVR